MKIKILEIVFNKYLKYIGPTGCILFGYYFFNQKKKEYKFKIKEITKSTGISKRSIISYNKMLKKIKLIDCRTVNIEGEWVYLIKINEKIKRPDATIAPCSSRSIIISRSINNISNINRSKYIKEEDSVIIAPSLRTKKENEKIIKYSRIIIKQLKEFTLYRAPCYQKIFKRKLSDLSQKEKSNIKRLLKEITKEKLSKYIEWWYKAKAKSFRGFSFGALATEGIIEEWKIKNKIIKDPMKKSDTDYKNALMKKGKENLIRDYLKTINLDKPPKEDREIILEAVQKKILKKSKNKYILVEK